MQVAL